MKRPALDENQAMAMIDRLVDPGGYEPEYRTQQELMLRCMSFYIGKQHFVQQGAHLFQIETESEWEVQYRANIILPAVERAVEKVAGATGRFAVAPKSGKPEDRHAARTSDRVLKNVWEASDYQDEKEMVVKWAAIVGTGFLRTTWDARAGEPQRFYTDEHGGTKLPANNDEALALEAAGQFTDLHDGDVCYDAYSPFQIGWDWDCRGQVKKAKWLSESALVSVPSVMDQYGLSEEQVERAGHVPGSTVYEETLAFITSGVESSHYGYVPRQKDQMGRSLVRALYHRPTSQYPNGLYIVAVGRKVVIVRDNPYRISANGIPFVKMDWFRMPGRFLGVGLVEQLMNPQFHYNRARSRMIEFQDVMGQPAMFIDKASGLPTDLVIRPGSVYHTNDGSVPKFADPPQMPTETRANVEMSSIEIDRISSQSDPESGSAPGEMRSGVALEKWFGEKNRIITPIARRALLLDRDVGRQTLALCRERYPLERTVMVAGDIGEYEALAFKAADLHHDVRVQGEPMDADQAMAFKAELMDLMQVGALDPVNNREHWRMMINAFEYKTLDEGMRDFTLDQRNQEREIREILADPAKYIESGFPVAEFEDHVVHAETVARFMKGDEFRELDEVSQSVLYVHYQQHVQVVQEAMMAQMKMAEATQGAPGAKGQASQPNRTR